MEKREKEREKTMAMVRTKKMRTKKESIKKKTFLICLPLGLLNFQSRKINFWIFAQMVKKLYFINFVKLIFLLIAVKLMVL
jgi:hypothetical protein